MPEAKRKIPTLPDDEIARKLESGKLWRRAICRWCCVLTKTEDAAYCRTDCSAYSLVPTAGTTKTPG